MYRTLVVLVFLLFSSLSYASFNEYFIDKTMRVDYVHAGNNLSEHYYIEQIKQEPYWAGSLNHLIDTFKYGKYFFEIYDEATATFDLFSWVF